MQRILDRYQIHYPFLLYAGRTNPQKNISRLVEAFAVLRGEMADDPVYRDLRLIIIGGVLLQAWGTMFTPRLSDDVYRYA